MLVETVLSMLTLVCHFQKGHAPGLDVFSRPARLQHGRLQYTGPVVWFTAHCVGLRAPLDSGI